MRAFETLFAVAEADADFCATRIVMSMLEVYNEQVRDLLVAKPPSRSASADDASLEVRMGKDGTFVENLTEWPVRNVDEVSSLIAMGGTNRQTASNNVNEHSSRSHLVIIVKVRPLALSSSV